MITEDKRNVNIKNSGSRSKSVHEVHLTHHHGVGFGQPCLNRTGLLFGGMKGRLRDPEMDLKLAVFLSRLGITVLGHPPLSEETSGVIAIVGVRRIR